MISTLSLLWIGILVGVSFLATPIKFRAELLTQPAALEVGRVTFQALARVEWLLAALVTVSWMRIAIGATDLAAAGMAAIAILTIQGLWVRPLLDERVELIMDGKRPSPSPLHKIYVVLEVAKMAALVALAVIAG